MGTNGDGDPIHQIGQMISRITGVQLGERQRAMVESRLGKRLSELGLSTFEEYLEYIQNHRVGEIEQLVSLLTTHHTFFFREFGHFEFLINQGLPKLIESVRKRGDKTIRVWSAACSGGHEAYSLSMFLYYHLKLIAPDVSFTIVATDIDPESISIANNGVYKWSELKEVPLNYLGNHWAKGNDDISEYAKAKSTIRSPCSFETMNLTQIPESYSIEGAFDIIFCRNVYIYFNAEQIKKITQNLLKSLAKDGFIFIGISETLNGLDLPVTSMGPSVYTHRTAESVKEVSISQKPKEILPLEKASAPKPSVSPPSSPIRVLCVDDSPSIQTLMKQILKKEEGFEVVATAINGIEAAQKLKQFKVDLLTLDIHMPQQSGIEYLEKNFGPTHPPVVMVSSASRADSNLALRALALGASDYVEKPTLSNLTESADEIRTKLWCAHLSRQTPRAAPLELDRSFIKDPVMRSPESKVRVIVASYTHLDKLKAFFRELKGTQPPTYLLVEGMENALEAFAKELSSVCKSIDCKGDVTSKDKADHVSVADLKKNFASVASVFAGAPASILVFGVVSKQTSDKLLNWKNAQLLLEDLGNSKTSVALSRVATDIVPATSFAYLSSAFFCGDYKL